MVEVDGRVGDVHPSLVDAVQDYIRDKIVSGELQPGQRLVERELAEATGASRIPVREAIRGLASERFVTLVPRRGAVVTALVPEDLDEIFEVREALEVQECVLAAQKATPEERARMWEFVRAAQRALDAGDEAAVDAANGVKQGSGVCVFEEESAGPGAECSVDVLIEFVHAQHEHPNTA